jgi:type I restriction enzyme S subunit
MELRPGYKQTEVGVIPEDWEVGSISDLVHTMKSGLSRRLQVQDIGIPVLTSGNIQNNRLVTDELKYWYSVDPQGANTDDYVLNDGDILLCFINSISQIGKPCIFRELGRPVIYTTNIFRIVASKQSVPEFACFLFSSTSFQKAIQLIVKPAINQASFTKPDFLQICVPLPPTKAEQEAIAEALSDTDALIESLEQLISKKRHIKQGAMQELLTGKKRLPGFSGEWEVKRLDSVAEIRSGGTPSTNQPDFWDGEVLWCTPTDITGLKGYKYLSQTSRTITTQGLKCSSAELVPADSVVMTSRATIGECAINVTPVATNQGFKNFIPFKETDVDFLYYLLQTKKQDFISLCGGSTFLEIGKTQLAAFEIALPKEKPEQTAITSILSAMDAEITNLETKLSKTRQLKQGMMHNLLTGRIRLI